MTPDELKKKLIDMGLDIDQKVWRKTNSVDPKSLPAIKRQIELLNSFKSLVEQQVEKDIAAVDDLKMKMAKLKHGGGE